MTVTEAIDQRLHSNLERVALAEAAYSELVVQSARDDTLADDVDGTLRAAGKTLAELRADIERIAPVFVFLTPLPAETVEVKRRAAALWDRICMLKDSVRHQASRLETHAFVAGTKADLSSLAPLQAEIAELESQWRALEIPDEPPLYPEGEALVRRLRAQIEAAMTPRWHEAHRRYDDLQSQVRRLEQAARGDSFHVDRHRNALLRLGYDQRELGRVYGSGVGMRNYREVTIDRAACEDAIRQREFQLQKTPEASFADRVERELSDWRLLLQRIERAEAELPELRGRMEEPLEIMAEEAAEVERLKSDGDYLARLALDA